MFTCDDGSGQVAARSPQCGCHCHVLVIMETNTLILAGVWLTVGRLADSVDLVQFLLHLGGHAFRERRLATAEISPCHKPGINFFLAS